MKKFGELHKNITHFPRGGNNSAPVVHSTQIFLCIPTVLLIHSGVSPQMGWHKTQWNIVMVLVNMCVGAI